jgi:putative addiction module CopG family antidote
MSLSIPPEFERAVLERVQSGAYESTDDVLKACLEALEMIEAEDDEWLRHEIQRGVDSAERGELIPREEAIELLRAEVSVSAVAAGEQRSAMNLDVPPEFERAVLERVDSGKYGSTDAALQACLAALSREEPADAAKLDALRGDVQHAMDQYERGEYSPVDEVFARLRAKLQRSTAP